LLESRSKSSHLGRREGTTKLIAEAIILVNDKTPVCPGLAPGKEIDTIIRYELIELMDLLMVHGTHCKETDAGEVLIHYTNDVVWFRGRNMAVRSIGFPCNLLPLDGLQGGKVDSCNFNWAGCEVVAG
jgi:hypothetical protein